MFKNSVVANDLDFIRMDDPSTPFKLTSTGSARKEMPDKRSDDLFLDDVLTYQITYENGSSVALWASPALGPAASKRYANHVGNALAKLPEELRRKLSHVVLHDGNETAFAEEVGRFFVIYSENIDRRLATHDLEETVFHETIHATLEAVHAKSPAWIRAQKSDPGFMTEYAAKLPEKEDLPESALFAYTLWKSPGRLPKAVERAVRETMPNRLVYLSRLFQSFDVKRTLKQDKPDSAEQK